MPPSKSVYDQPPGAPTPVVREEHIEYGFIGKLQNLKYEYRADIRDRASLERNFREKFEALNRVKLSDGEFARLLDEIVTPDVFTTARINTLTAGEGLSETAIREGYMGLFDLVEEEAPPGVHCIKIIVASGSEKPYAKKKYGLSEKGCFIRIGTAAEPMPVAMIEKLFASRTRNSIGKIKSHRQALSFEQLRIYYDEKRKPLNKQFKTNLELITENGALNYAAYLLADENGTSIKVAKYRGKDRIHLIESNEYGYCSLIKATKSVLDKLDLENKTASTITAKERIDVRLWNPVALREAVINAIVHNDYTREVPPKFEIFADRIEITSACALPEGLTQAEFFEGYSIPRNKELMRIFKDLEMVEHLGSGLPRITEFYGPECFRFTDNFLRITFAASRPVHDDAATEQVAAPVTPPVAPPVTPPVGPYALKLLELLALRGPLGNDDIRQAFALKDRRRLRETYLAPALVDGLIEYTIPDKPNSRLQQYRLTEMGRSVLK